MMEFIFILYVCVAPIVALAQMQIHSQLYDEDDMIWDYCRLVALWPLVIMGIYK